MTHTSASTDLTTDVLIVGYGPSGATLANLMGRRGHRVIIIDQAAAIYDKPRAITADQEALRIFQEIGLADEITASTSPHPGTNFVSVTAQQEKENQPDPVRLADLFGVDVIVLFRRLALVPGARWGVVICDGSGTITFRREVPGFALPRFGAQDRRRRPSRRICWRDSSRSRAFRWPGFIGIRM